MPKSEVFLAFDFGLKRIGVAVGQTLTGTASPLETLDANQGIPDWGKINSLIKEWKPTALVVGLPLNMDGTEQPFTQKVKGFVDDLKKRCSLPVYLADERLSSVEARQFLFEEGGYAHLKSKPIDGMAAKLILESWFKESSMSAL